MNYFTRKGTCETGGKCITEKNLMNQENSIEWIVFKLRINIFVTNASSEIERFLKIQAFVSKSIHTRSYSTRTTKNTRKFSKNYPFVLIYSKATTVQKV